MNKDTTKFAGTFHFEQLRDGKVIDAWDANNKVTLEGRAHMLDVVFTNTTSPVTSWSIGLMDSNSTPNENWTDANFTSTYSATESSAYDEGTRQEWVEILNAPTASITNDASKAAFTMNAATTIYGAMLESKSIKGDRTGVLMACATFTGRTVADNDVLNITYTLNTSTT